MLNTQEKAFVSFLKGIKSLSFLIIWLILMVVSFFFFDKSIARFFQPHDTILYTISSWVTPFGYPNIYIVATIVLALVGYFFLKHTRLFQGAIFMLVSLISTEIVQVILKVLLGRARPAMLFEHDQFGFYFLQHSNDYWGLPSGLVTTMTAIFMSLCFIFPRYWLWFITIMILLSLTRLVVTIHFLSDVMATLYIMTWVVIGWAALCKKNNWLLWRKRNPLDNIIP